jgi:polyisoprenoid-binding protein YceI
MTENTRVEPAALSEVTGAWALDPRRTTIRFRTRSMWVRTVDGTLRAPEGAGAVGGDGRITGRLVIDSHSIDTNSKMRDGHLRNADFFDVRNYPTMAFEVTGARLDAPGHCAIEGTLTIRGVTRPLELPAVVRMGGDGSVTINARADIDRSEWGMGWSRMGAGLRNQVTVEATFIRRDVS